MKCKDCIWFDSQTTLCQRGEDHHIKDSETMPKECVSFEDREDFA